MLFGVRLDVRGSELVDRAELSAVILSLPHKVRSDGDGEFSGTSEDAGPVVV